MSFNNPFDPNMMKFFDGMMKNLQNQNNNHIPFNYKKITKYIFLIILSIFFSGFGIGLFIGLMF